MTVQYTHNITSELQMFFAQAGSCQMEGITALYNYIMSFLAGILCVVTMALILIIFYHLHGQRHINQYRLETNLNLLIEWLKYLQRWTHSTILELVWTIIPTIILIAIAIPSFILLYSLDEIVDTQTVIKVTAFQWYWKYEYPVIDVTTGDVINFSYLSYMIPTPDLTEENNLRLLEVDMPLVVPINVNVKFIITSKDVIHSFAVPALGIKMDAVPGRLNQVTVHIYKPGIYFGQCSELCGVNHAFMPIALHAVDFNTFENFLLKAIESLNKETMGSLIPTKENIEIDKYDIDNIPEETLLKYIAAIDGYGESVIVISEEDKNFEIDELYEEDEIYEIDEIYEVDEISGNNNNINSNEIEPFELDDETIEFYIQLVQDLRSIKIAMEDFIAKDCDIELVVPLTSKINTFLSIYVEVNMTPVLAPEGFTQTTVTTYTLNETKNIESFNCERCDLSEALQGLANANLLDETKTSVISN